MCQVLSPNEVPVAVSMIQFARKADRPFHEFVCYWTAFNNIYAILATNNGHGPRRRKEDKKICGIKIPSFRSSEYSQIQYTRSQFCSTLKQELIVHESTEWFFNRTAKWNGDDIREDAQGHKLNGVINVGFTLDAQSPVWSPICAADYQNYNRNAQPDVEDDLAEQIVNVLYTVRNNLIHAGKRPDDATDEDVTRKAVPLLRIIISHFLPAIPD